MKTQFRKGTSGNPAGRPKGSGVAGALREAIVNDAPAIVSSLIEQAKAGDTTAARVLLDRVCPALKPQAEAVPLPPLTAGSFTDKGAAILEAVADGAIAPDVAAQLVQAVAQLAKVAEIDDIERRLAALEGKE